MSIVRLVTLIQVDLHSPDLDWNYSLVGVWTVTETNIAVVCGRWSCSIAHPELPTPFGSPSLSPHDSMPPITPSNPFPHPNRVCRSLRQSFRLRVQQAILDEGRQRSFYGR